ncbi:hypothetical protein [Peribacillus frigoritolerans]|uniref:hypothetical protein n=1 Tax=Peribacillus frigoritolerans TaxID=450367 RepID=UPI003F80DFB9
MKNKNPIIPFQEQIKIVNSNKYVDIAVSEEDTDKLIAWDKYKFDLIFKGDDWKGTPKWVRYEEEFSMRN